MSAQYDRGTSLELEDKDLALTGSSIILPSDTYQQYDDFNRGTISASAYGWTLTAGAGGTAAVTTTAVAGGVARQISSTTDNLIAEIKGDTANWKASNGGLVFETRLRQVTSLADVAFCAGLMNAGTYTTTTWALATTTYADESDLTDGVGFLFDTDATTDTIRCVSTETSVLGTHANAGAFDSGVVPVVDTFIKLKVKVDTAGTATYYINDTFYGTVTGAIDPSISLIPFVQCGSRTTDAKTQDVDYIFVSGNRTA